MAGQYDYTVNIPQPPAQNFLQSLLGIQQLKGLQQQQDIQAQQSAFAQQEQPLREQQLKAQIAASQASAAGSESMTNARNYDLGKQKELDTRLQWLSKSENFTVDNLQQAAVEFHKYDPTLFVRAGEMRKAIPAEGQLFLDKTSEKLLFAGVTGKKDDALSVLDESIKAAEGSDKFKQYVPQLQDLRTKIDENPEKTQSLIAMSQIVFRGDKGKSVIEQIGELAKTKKIEAETNLDLSKLPQPGQMKLSDKQQENVNALTRSAADARNQVEGLANQLDLITNFAKEKPTEFSQGSTASFENFVSKVTGNTSQIQNLRSGLQPSATKEWIQKASGLKGALSDKEGARLDKGAPDVMTAGPAELLSWGRLVSKVTMTQADMDDLDAAWQQNVGTLQSKSKENFNAAGVDVKPGDSYGQVRSKMMAQYKKKSQEDIQRDALLLKEIESSKKSSIAPVPNMYNIGGAPQQQQPAAAPNQATILSDRESLLNRYR